MDFSPSLLTPKLLENNPYKYMELLEYFYENKMDISHQLNTKVYNTWYSNHLFCLIYLVGDLHANDNNEDIDENVSGFYGCSSSISEDMGIKILHLLVKSGVNTKDTNYYKETIYDFLRLKTGLTYRKNNTKFVEAIIKSVIKPNNSEP
jgi:hypothetical protein